MKACNDCGSPAIATISFSEPAMRAEMKRIFDRAEVSLCETHYVLFCVSAVHGFVDTALGIKGDSDGN